MVQVFTFGNVSCSDLLDGNWLSAIDSIVITIFVFLLGVPLLIFQTFLPDGVKDVYNRRFFIKSDLIIVGLLGLVGFIIIFVFGNHGFKYNLLYNHECDFSTNSYAHENGACDVFSIMLFYRIGCFSLLTFSGLSISYFIVKIYKSRRIREMMVKMIVDKALDSKYYGSKYFSGVPKDVVDDLSVLGKSSELPVHKAVVIEAIRTIVQKYLDNSLYWGASMNNLIDQSLLETVCYLPEHCNRENYRKALDVVDIICLTGKASFDSSEVSTFLGRMAINTHEAHFTREYMRCVRYLFSLPKGNVACYKLAKEAWRKNDHYPINEEIIEIKNRLLKVYGPIDEVYFPNLCAYLSWFYNFNYESKKYFTNYIDRNLPPNTITEKTLSFAHEYFTSELVDFETAASIKKMSDDLFPEIFEKEMD